MDEDYHSKDYIEVVDKEPTTKRVLRTEERERINLLPEERLSREERQRLEGEVLEGGREVELYEESWTPAHDVDLDRVHEYIDTHLGEGGRTRPKAASGRSGSTTSKASPGQGTTGGFLGPGDREQLERAVPGEVLDHEVVYRTRSGYVVRVRYRSTSGSEQRTLVNLSRGSVSFLEDIEREIDDQPVELDEIDLPEPAPPSGVPETTPEPAEPEETAEPEEAAEPAEAAESEVVEEPAPEPVEEVEDDEDDEEAWSEEDLELAEELGIEPDELADLTGETEEEPSSGGGLGGLVGGSDEEEPPETDEGEEDASGGGLGSKLPFGKKKETEADEETPEDADEADEEAGSGGGLGGKLPFGKKKGTEADEETSDDEDADAEEGEGGGFKDKLPFGK